MEAQLHSFLQKALNGGEQQASCYRRFTSDKDFCRSPLSRRLGGPTAGLDKVKGQKSRASEGNPAAIARSVSQQRSSLYRPSCPASQRCLFTAHNSNDRSTNKAEQYQKHQKQQNLCFSQNTHNSTGRIAQSV